MKKTMSDYMSDSHTSGGHLSYLEDLYESYLLDPDSITEEWKAYFNELPFQNGSQKDSSHLDVIKHFQNVSRRSAPRAKVISQEKNPLEAKVQTLIKLIETMDIPPQIWILLELPKKLFIQICTKQKAYLMQMNFQTWLIAISQLEVMLNVKCVI